MSRGCSMTRRKVFASLAAAVTTGSLDTVAGRRPAEAAGEASSSVILGKGKYRYQVVEKWGELPPGYAYGDTAAVCVDSKDNVYVFTALIPSSSTIGRENFCAPGARISALPMPTVPRWVRTTCSISPTILGTRCAARDRDPLRHRAVAAQAHLRLIRRGGVRALDP
jgi:hypothetical protein